MVLRFLLLLQGSLVLASAFSCSGQGEKQCISHQPPCQYCGNGGEHMPRAWEPCLALNASATTPPPFVPCVFPAVAATASYRGTLLANSSRARVVEGNVYFPRDDVALALFARHAGKTYQVGESATSA